MTGMKQNLLAALTLVALVAIADRAQATLLTVEAGSGGTADAPAAPTGWPSTGALSVQSASLTGLLDNLSVPVTNLYDGSLGPTGSANPGAWSYCAISGPDTILTYTFDTTTTNRAGYDITKIETYAGWLTNFGGRSNQGYTVTLTYMDDTTAVLFATNQANSPENYWTKVLTTNSGGGTLNNGSGVVASGVKSITWSNFQDAAVGAPGVFWREFAVYGTATVTPEPSTIVLLAVGMLGMLAYAWRKGR
jgi:hypothetical protein